MFKFTVKHTHKNSHARAGVFKTPHGTIHTPVFMPVGTKASVKTLSEHDLQTLDTKIILANTYHLFLRPGEKLIQKMGGLHKWMSHSGPILTDSGGYQVFSLGQGKNFNKNTSRFAEKTSVKISEEGVIFKSHLDGKTHHLTPEKAIQIQHDLGADIIMTFDECAPAHCTKKYFQEAMQRTHNWALRCQKEHQKLLKKQKHQQVLFGIVQGGIYKDLRKESAQFINNLDFFGNAIGGLSVGETHQQMLEMLDHTVPHLSEKKPRYLMGVGTPLDLLEAVDRGIDMFDCVHPTRMARHGAFWTETGRYSIRNEKFKNDRAPLQKSCQCETCKNYSKSYLRHLIFENEISGLRLMTIHNLHFLLNLMQEIRQSIEKDTFPTFKKKFLKKFHQKDEKD